MNQDDTATRRPDSIAAAPLGAEQCQGSSRPGQNASVVTVFPCLSVTFGHFWPVSVRASLFYARHSPLLTLLLSR